MIYRVASGFVAVVVAAEPVKMPHYSHSIRQKIRSWLIG